MSAGRRVAGFLHAAGAASQCFMLMLPIGFDMLMLISQTYRIRCPDKLDNWPARDKAPVCLHGRKQTDKQTDNALGPKQTGHRYTLNAWLFLSVSFPLLLISDRNIRHSEEEQVFKSLFLMWIEIKEKRKYTLEANPAR